MQGGVDGVVEMHVVDGCECEESEEAEARSGNQQSTEAQGDHWLGTHCEESRYMPLPLSALSKAIYDRCLGIKCVVNRVFHEYDYCVAVV